MPHPVPLRAGDPSRVGRYRLTGRVVGLPSEDPIFVAVDPADAEVSISLLAGDWAIDGAARDRFAAEAAVAKRVPPFCAARVLDAGLDGDHAYLVSEYVPGQSLLEVVAEQGVRAGQELEAVAIGMATGLASVHQAGLVHGGFGPQYVILPSQGPPRVVEFGITPPYGSATPSADMLAWAQTVVFAATGRPPSQSGDIDTLPALLREPVQQCLEFDASERPAARAVVQFLLGDAAVPAGVLAEGSRRAARPASWPAQQPAARQAGPDRPAAPRVQPPPRPGRHPAEREAPAGARHSTDGAVPSRHGPAQRRTGRGQSGANHAVAWLAGAATVVIVLIALLIVHLVQGGGSDQLSANTRPPDRASPTPHATSPSPSQGPVIPAVFGGTWSGQVTQPPSDTYNVTVTFTPGQPVGSITYAGSDFTCSGDLNLTAATSAKMIMSQGIVHGQSTCEDGTVSITASGQGTVVFHFEGTPAASGTLTRS